MSVRLDDTTAGAGQPAHRRRALPAGLQRRRPGADPRDHRRRGDPGRRRPRGRRGGPRAPVPHPHRHPPARDAARPGSTPRSRSAASTGSASSPSCACAGRWRTTSTRSSCRCSCPTRRSSCGGPARRPDVPAEDPVGRLAQRRITDSPRPRRAAQGARGAPRRLPAPATPTWPGPGSRPWRALLASALDQPYEPITSAHVSRASAATRRACCSPPGCSAASASPSSVRASRGPGITAVTLHTTRGDIAISRPDGRRRHHVAAGLPGPRGGAAAGVRPRDSSPRSCAGSTPTRSTARRCDALATLVAPAAPSKAAAKAAASEGSAREGDPEAVGGHEGGSRRRHAASTSAHRRRRHRDGGPADEHPRGPRPPRRRGPGGRDRRPAGHARSSRRRRRRPRPRLPHRRHASASPCLAALAASPSRDAVDWPAPARLVGRRAVPARAATPTATRRRPARRCSTTCRSTRPTCTRCRAPTSSRARRRRGRRARTPTTLRAEPRARRTTPRCRPSTCACSGSARTRTWRACSRSGRACTRPSARVVGVHGSPKPPPDARVADHAGAAGVAARSGSSPAASGKADACGWRCPTPARSRCRPPARAGASARSFLLDEDAASAAARRTCAGSPAPEGSGRAVGPEPVVGPRWRVATCRGASRGPR